MGVTLREDLPKIEAALQRLYDYCDALIADRRDEPARRLRHRAGQCIATRGWPAVSDTELRDAMVLLIFGGFDTTRNQLGLAMQTFMAHPDQWRLLAERPELGGTAVEEVMRVNPTVRWVTREVLEDFEYEGVQLDRRHHRPPLQRVRRHRPAGVRAAASTSPQSVSRTSVSVAAPTTAWATSWPAPT